MIDIILGFFLGYTRGKERKRLERIESELKELNRAKVIVGDGGKQNDNK